MTISRDSIPLRLPAELSILMRVSVADRKEASPKFSINDFICEAISEKLNRSTLPWSPPVGYDLSPMSVPVQIVEDGEEPVGYSIGKPFTITPDVKRCGVEFDVSPEVAAGLEHLAQVARGRQDALMDEIDKSLLEIAAPAEPPFMDAQGYQMGSIPADLGFTMYADPNPVEVHSLAGAMVEVVDISHMFDDPDSTTTLDQPDYEAMCKREFKQTELAMAASGGINGWKKLNWEKRYEALKEARERAE